MIAAIDADGRRIEYDHDIDGRTETVKDRRGITTVYVYNDRGDVIAETNGASETTQRTYDSNGSQLSETNAAGETHSWTYDQRGNVLTETNGAGETVTNAYGPFNQLNTQTDALGHVTFTNDYLNYTAGGQPIYPGPLYITTDANGHRTHFSYDSRGQLDTLTDPTGAVSHMTYDSHGFLVTRIEADGSRTDYSNDVMGRVLNETHTRTRADGTQETVLTEYTLDSKGRVTATHHPDGSVTTTDYDANDKPLSECDALNRCTTMHYDALGQVDRTEYADGSVETTGYDANGNVIAQTDRGGRTTRMVYDAANRLLETIAPDATGDDGDDSNNSRTTNAYDLAGRLLTTTDENGNATRYEYDAAGRQTAVVQASVDGNEARTTSIYDAAGRRSATIDAEGHRTDVILDPAGRLTATLHDDGSESHVEYDDAGRKTADIDEMNRRTEYAYDSNGRLSEVRLAADTPEQTVTTYAYDESGNKIRQTDAEGRITRWEYDAMGREVARILPEGQRESSTYNATGERITHTDFNGQTTRYEYDQVGRLIRTDFPNDVNHQFGYDANGQRISANDSRGESTLTHDARGRTLRVTDADGGVIEYQYDDLGNLLARISQSQSLVYSYDERRRVASVIRTVDGESPTTTRYEYDQDGNRIAMEGGDGIRTEYSYDCRHRLTSMVKKTAAGALMLAMTYTVDASGMRTIAEESDSSGTIRTVVWQYDELRRLTQEAIDHRDNAKDRVSQWTYDQVGNRRSQAVVIGGSAAEATNYTYDQNDRLLAESSNRGVTVYSYDANGNTLSKLGLEDEAHYRYDDQNHLIEAITAAGVTDYVYNVDGLRVRQTYTPTGGTPTTIWYLQDSGYAYAQVIEEWTSESSGSRTLSATYTFADELVSQTRYAENMAGSGTALLPTTRFIQADGFGSTRWLTDSSGTITDAIDYSAFGEEISRSGTTDIEHLYRGERFDANVGFYDLRARLYNPTIGRFLTQDSFAGFSMDPQSLHKYSYASGDPIDLEDPSGNMSSLVETGVTMTVSGIINASIGAIMNVMNPTKQSVWGDFGTDFAVGAVLAPVGGLMGRVLGPVLRGLAAPVLRAVARIKPLVLTGRVGWERLAVSMSRTLFRTTRGYPSVQSTLIGRTLKLLFPAFKWEQHHIFIQQAWSRVGSRSQLFQDLVANEGLRRLGNGAWNLMPIPRALNGLLGRSEFGTQLFASMVYSVAVFGPYQIFDAVEDAVSGQAE